MVLQIIILFMNNLENMRLVIRLLISRLTNKQKKIQILECFFQIVLSRLFLSMKTKLDNQLCSPWYILTVILVPELHILDASYDLKIDS